MDKKDAAKAAAEENSNLQSQGTASQKSVSVNIKSLIEAGAHFGHQTTKWNPKMLPYIYGERNGVHIINLDISVKAWEKAKKYIYDTIASGGNILFVGTKQQAREVVKSEALRSDSFFVTSRWLGGTLSNFETIKRSIERMRKLEDLLLKADDENSDIELNKKEKLMIRRQLEKLEANLGGIRNMRKTPEIIFVIDVNKEDIAVAEARRLHIPVVALVDTNSDPDMITYAIPSNDDASRTIRLFVTAIADTVIQARAAYKARVPSSESREGSQDKTANGSKSKRSVVEIAEGEKAKEEGISANQEAVAS